MFNDNYPKLKENPRWEIQPLYGNKKKLAFEEEPEYISELENNEASISEDS